ncbi:hypothetical protein MLD38_022886 [Melastoma candidum]|uniref:Uncharacterized protein n=1 Tax=Melastoma candidum TaxID=119954 RepID=A0ACB9QP69_9MYRT|nr:hypothetical protein MLD38_022886 [Melastoma candidum]
MAKSHQISAIPPLTTPVTRYDGRRSAEYDPSVWGDYFLRCAAASPNPTDAVPDLTEGTLRELVMKVKAVLTSEADADHLLWKLELIDRVQRLGIAYHFEKEMDEELSKLYGAYTEFVDGQGNRGCERLHMVALYFRLLRQQGYKVSCDVFNEFKDNDGKFDETVIQDLRGMLSLYEASQLMVHGEDILQEALDFTAANLKTIDQERHGPHLVNLIRQALNQQIRKGLPRLEAWHYIQIYETEPSLDRSLLDLAKLDFNSLQRIHQKEIQEIVRWWKDGDFSKTMTFARDRVVECYFWSLGVYFEPEYAFARKFMTKIIALVTIMDDMYDAYSTLGELEAYTEALLKWDEDDASVDRLPDYMQWHYRWFLGVYREAEEELARRGQLYSLPYSIQSMKDLVAGYLREVKWFFGKYTPMLDEYMELALVTCTYPALITHSFVGMGDAVTEDAFKWISGNPKMLKAAATICRNMDDVVGRKFEQTRGHVASGVECYIKQYGGTEEEAEAVLMERVSEAWKDINEALMRPFEVPATVLTRVLNFARVMDVLYKDKDNFTHNGTLMKQLIGQMLVNPLPM